MGLIIYRPTSPGRRNMISTDFAEITKSEPEKSLIVHIRAKAGRNNRGVITTRHQGGGVKRYLRIIDFKRDKLGVPGRVAAIEYDPYRTARIALINYADGEKRYILAPQGLNVGDTVMAGENAEIRPGNSLPMQLIPTGTFIHNIELVKGKGGQLVRSAGTGAQLMGKDGDFALLRMPSGEIRRIPAYCAATIGLISNEDHKNIKIGKAGRNRHRGIRPTVRGTAMSPRDHPHGGGSARNPIGFPGPKTPWGKPARGKITRRKQNSDSLIVKGRREK